MVLLIFESTFNSSVKEEGSAYHSSKGFRRLVSVLVRLAD